MHGQPGGGTEQLSGLALDDVQVSRFIGVRIVHMQQLQDFALGDAVGGVGQALLDGHRIQTDHQLEGARIQEIADQNARGIAPESVGGLAPAPQVGFIDDVVMQQGGGMDEFDDGGQSGVVLPGVTGSARGHCGQHRTQTLAAGGDDVFGNLVDQQNVRTQFGPNQDVNRVHFVLGQSLDGFNAHKSTT